MAKLQSIDGKAGDFMAGVGLPLYPRSLCARWAPPQPLSAGAAPLALKEVST